MWFGRRTQISNGFGCAEVSGNGAIWFNCYDVAAMPRFCDSTSRHLNQRFSSWNLQVVFRRMPGSLHSNWMGSSKLKMNCSIMVTRQAGTGTRSRKRRHEAQVEVGKGH